MVRKEDLGSLEGIRGRRKGKVAWTLSRVYLIVYWPRSSPTSPSHALLPAPMHIAPIPSNLSPSLSQMAPKPCDSTFPSASPFQAFSSPPLPRDAPPSPRLAMWSLSFSSHLFTLVYLVFDAGADPTCYITVCGEHSAGE